ncbi:hypothetical protein FRC03_003439 [Tulasnella sp. 419]|nr:hypothetical protein FRC03_003439 [Tulasnella sp. 419]
MQSGINPSLINAPSPSSSTSSQSATSRKRQRLSDGITSEERKEARAERNRIAAQISRDRRKAEFEELKHKVTFLERENATLRATIATSGITTSSNATLALSQRELERERENQELKERVKMLEKAWESVVSALHGVGGAAGLTLPAVSSLQKASSTSASAPIQANVDTTITSTSSPLVEVSDLASTRHLARVAYILSHSVDDEMSLQRVEPVTTTKTRLSHPSTPPPSSITPSKTQYPHHSSQIKTGSAPCLKATRLHQHRPSCPRSSIRLRLKPHPWASRRHR